MISRRMLLGMGLATAATYATPAYAQELLNPDSAFTNISSKYWTHAANIPFLFGLENGFFQLAGLNLSFTEFDRVHHLAKAIATRKIDASPMGLKLLSDAVIMTEQPKIIAISVSKTRGLNLAPNNHFGSAAVISAQFVREQPKATAQFVAAYKLAINCLQENPKVAAQYLPKGTRVDSNLGKIIAGSEHKLFADLSNQDVSSFQRLIDDYGNRGMLARKLDVASLLLQKSDLV